MAVSMPSIFLDAKQLLEDNLSTNRRVVVRRYNDIFANSCNVIHFHIEAVEDEEQYANLDISLNYKERVILSSNGIDRFDEVERYRQLKILCNLGDIAWTYRTIEKVWNGDYPSAVAVDTDTKEVFLINIRTSSIELVKFGIFSSNEFEAFITDVQEREPYRIGIADDAMFRYIDGATGINDLVENVYIQFNCGVPIRVMCTKGDRLNG